MYLRSTENYLRACRFSAVVAPACLKAAAYTERRALLPQPWAPGVSTASVAALGELRQRGYALSSVTAGARHRQGPETQNVLGVPAVESARLRRRDGAQEKASAPAALT